jgi:hypothetical protein
MRRIHAGSSPPGDWLTLPATAWGRWASGLAGAAIGLALFGELARGEVGAPFYRVAFASGILGGIASLVAIRRGEHSLLALLALLPLVVALAFGVASLLG